MTTANLVLTSLAHERKSYVLRKWHNGYEVGEFLKRLLEGWQDCDAAFGLENVAEILTCGEEDFDYEVVKEKEGNGKIKTGFETIDTNWTWSCVLINEKEALITGSNGSQVEVYKV